MTYSLRLSDRSIPLDPVSVPQRRAGGLGVKVTDEEIFEVLETAVANPDDLRILVAVDGRAARSTSDRQTTSLAATLLISKDEHAFDVLALTRAGRAIRVPVRQVGPRFARLIKLAQGDLVVAALLVPNRTDAPVCREARGTEGSIVNVQVDHPPLPYLVAIANASGGANVFDAARVGRQHRGATGRQVGPEGVYFAVGYASDTDVAMVTAAGQVLRPHGSDIRRNYSARRHWSSVMRLRESDRVVGICVLSSEF